MVCTFHALDHVISHPWYYRWVKQANLQDYPVELSVVKGLPMAAISGLGGQSREATISLDDALWYNHHLHDRTL